MKTKNIDIIAINIVNMISTNFPYKTDCIGEKFEDWCENGDVFYNEEYFKEEDSKECEQIMKTVAPLVNQLTDKLYELYEKGK